ncbi:MAG: 2,3-bisphosphoglycerate-independent phosphoglycerate mutase [Candidatus Aenigmarchaeota archaeon]|nr:2,3-bisphosphoglycerate-independent phosphoglycerate mutase [Candidatus Aenigmarchaeota archaeon]
MAVEKTLLIICDGMPDSEDEDGNTPLSTAYHPGLDFLAKNGLVGRLDLKYEKSADTDQGVLKILGCYDDSYPGRGYIEALSTDLEARKGDVCFRANFATLNGDGMLIDRRAGRDETGLEELAKKLDGIEINNIRFSVRRAVGHRLVIVMRRLDGKPLSWNIEGNDPKKTGVAVKQVAAKTRNGRITASALNKFLRRVNKILEEHPVNKKRKIPANTVLIRNIGHPTKTESFESRYNKKACVIGYHSTIEGVAKFLGMDFVKPSGATGQEDTDLHEKANAALETLQKYDFVLLHVNAFDMLSHDKKRDEKTAFIERFDQLVVRKILDNINLNKIVIAVTSDHYSNSLTKDYAHSTEPVPFVVCGAGIKSSGCEKYDEKNAVKFGTCKNLIEFLV